MVDSMSGHFSTIPLVYGSFEPPQLMIPDFLFAERMKAKLGLLVVMVGDATNAFWDCFAMGFFGRRGDMNLFQSLRGKLAAYILCMWKDKAIRDILIGSQTRFVNRAEKIVHLHAYLSLLSDPTQPIIQPRRPQECLEVFCTALMLGCRLSVLSLNIEGGVHCEDVGDKNSQLRVFVAFNGSKFFGLTKFSAQTSRFLNTSPTSSQSPHTTSSHHIHLPSSFQSSSATELRPDTVMSTLSQPVPDDFPVRDMTPLLEDVSILL
jgi:hypothetical protein